MSNTNNLPARELVRLTAKRLNLDPDERLRRFEAVYRANNKGAAPEWDSCGANPVGFNGTQTREVAS